MKAENESQAPASEGRETRAVPAGRWIRPAAPQAAGGDPPLEEIDALAGQLLREARERLSGLAAVERTLEERIKLRWQETEAEVRRKLAERDEELEATRRRVEAELKEARARGEKEGQKAGYREGFVRGREEGYRLGLEEGRREGLRVGREEEVRRLEGELSGAAAALAAAASEFQAKADELLARARRDLLDLAIEIAKRIVKREVVRVPETVVLNVKSALELIFRRGSIAIHVHPSDAPVVEKALAADPRWKHGFDAVEVRPALDVNPGGCRLVSGAGSVDMTLETQLDLIESALASAADEPGGDPAGDSSAPRAGADGAEAGVPGGTAEEGKP